MAVEARTAPGATSTQALGDPARATQGRPLSTHRDFPTRVASERGDDLAYARWVPDHFPTRLAAAVHRAGDALAATYLRASHRSLDAARSSALRLEPDQIAASPPALQLPRALALHAFLRDVASGAARDDRRPHQEALIEALSTSDIVLAEDRARAISRRRAQERSIDRTTDAMRQLLALDPIALGTYEALYRGGGSLRPLGAIERAVIRHEQEGEASVERGDMVLALLGAQRQLRVTALHVAEPVAAILRSVRTTAPHPSGDDGALPSEASLPSLDPDLAFSIALAERTSTAAQQLLRRFAPPATRQRVWQLLEAANFADPDHDDLADAFCHDALGALALGNVAGAEDAVRNVARRAGDLFDPGARAMLLPQLGVRPVRRRQARRTKRSEAAAARSFLRRNANQVWLDVQNRQLVQARLLGADGGTVLVARRALLGRTVRAPDGRSRYLAFSAPRHGEEVPPTRFVALAADLIPLRAETDPNEAPPPLTDRELSWALLDVTTCEQIRGALVQAGIEDPDAVDRADRRAKAPGARRFPSSDAAPGATVVDRPTGQRRSPAASRLEHVARR